MTRDKRIRTIIIGAAGRDFHNFNVLFRHDPRYRVVAFTAAQIPNIAGRKYPASLAGKHYRKGIPIWPEKNLEKLIRENDVEEAVFSYTDVSYDHVMTVGSRVTAAGAHFRLVSATRTMIGSWKPVISVCAVRTGSGKSQTSRRIARILRDMGKAVAVVRHPMPYGDLEKQKVQRFATVADMKKHHCTIEEMEEYEPHIMTGSTVFAGVDYGLILKQAEKEADVILWDGGNNDTPFYAPDLHIVVADPLRKGHGLSYYPGQTNLRLADVVIINKVRQAPPEDVAGVAANVRLVNEKAKIVKADSPLTVEHADWIKGKKVLVIEDGPTLTHGGMKFGAGMVAAKENGAAETIDPRPYVTGEMKKTFQTYPGIGTLLPAMGYGKKQVADLEATIRKVPCDLVIVATPVNLGRIVRIDKPALRVTYELREVGKPDLKEILKGFLKKH
ncbi:MAG: cyclic 2,3-diphosphoglycerate synthase [Planctomycetota bacterium]|jgi:predicted GTPase